MGETLRTIGLLLVLGVVIAGAVLGFFVGESWTREQTNMALMGCAAVPVAGAMAFGLAAGVAMGRDRRRDRDASPPAPTSYQLQQGPGRQTDLDYWRAQRAMIEAQRASVALERDRRQLQPPQQQDAWPAAQDQWQWIDATADAGEDSQRW